MNARGYTRIVFVLLSSFLLMVGFMNCSDVAFSPSGDAAAQKANVADLGDMEGEEVTGDNVDEVVTEIEQGNSDDGTSDDGTSDDGTSDDGTSDDGTSDDGTSDDGTSDDGTSDDGTSDDGTSDDGTSDDGTSDTSEISVDTVNTIDNQILAEHYCETGDGDNGQLRVLVCHIPPNNPANAHTKCLPLPALSGHFHDQPQGNGKGRGQAHGRSNSNHIDLLGACENVL